MPIYTAAALKTNQAAPVDFQAKGLDLARSTATKSNIYGLAHYPQIAYKVYTSLYPAFFKATVEKIRVPCDRIGYEFQIPAADLIPILPPPLVVHFPTPLRDNDEKKMLDSYGGSTFNIGKKRFYKFEEHGSDVIRALRQFGKIDPKCAVPRGSVNLQGYMSWMRTLKLVTAFLITQSYPAFDHGEEEEGAYESIEGLVTSKRKLAIDERGQKRARTENVADVEGDVDMSSEDVDDMGRIGFEIGLADVKPEERIPFAFPKREISRGWGSAGDLPACAGLSFPYFPGLLEEDYSFTPSLFRQYFLGSFGQLKENIFTNFREWRGGHGQFCMTDSGMVVQHISIGIQLAIECQARCFPIISGTKYYGFALCGGRYSVIAQDHHHLPLAQAAFMSEVTNMSIHDVALAKLMEELKLCKRDVSYKKGEKAITDPAAIKTARQLHEEIMKRNVPDEKEEVIGKLVADLSFPERYRPITVDNVLSAFNSIVDETPLDLEVPMYLGEGVATSTSMALRVLSMFGPIAPSLKNAGGRKWLIPDLGAADPASVVPQGKKVPALHTIVISKKDLFVAAADFREMIEDRAIYVKAERAAGFRSVVCTDKNRDVLWNGLKSLFSKVEKNSEFEKKRFDVPSKDIGGDKLTNEDDEVDLDAF